MNSKPPAILQGRNLCGGSGVPIGVGSREAGWGHGLCDGFIHTSHPELLTFQGRDCSPHFPAGRWAVGLGRGVGRIDTTILCRCLVLSSLAVATLLDVSWMASTATGWGNTADPHQTP